MIFDSKKGARGVLTRRGIIYGIGCSFIAPASAVAERKCETGQFGQQQCYAAMPAGSLQMIYANQQQSQWCWAASIQMLFRSYGYNVSQARIVQETFGTLVNMPAGSGAVISKQINRQWRDDQNRNFRSSLVAAYDFDFGIAAINNTFLVNNLDQNQPLIYGNKSHAMLLTRVEYIPTPAGPRIIAAGVLDPWPGNGARGLSQGELHPVHLGGEMRYLAAVRVVSA